MKEFATLRDLAIHLASDGVAEFKGIHHGLEAAAELLQAEAKAEIGVYQQGAGPFPAWAPLAEATKQDRVAKGYSEDEPLLRTGDLRDSIEKEVEAFEAIVGSTSEIMGWMENGTSRMPPRPVLGIALERNWEKIKDLVGHSAVAGFAGDKPISNAGDYDKR